MFVIAFALTGLGFVIAWRMNSTQGFHAIMNLFLMPLWFLSGALFPPQNAWSGLRWLMRVNPLSYGLAGLWRAIYLSEPEKVSLLPGWGMILVMSVGFALLMFGLATLMAGGGGWRATGSRRTMGTNHRKITIVLWAGLVLVTVGVVVGKLYKPRSSELPELFPAASFVLTDEKGQRFSNIDLAGHPYIAAFIFTRCGSSCPVVSARMAQVQKQTPAVVQLVSFSVDPSYGTPAVLDRYAKSYQADETRWHFLTGEASQMADVEAGMKVSAPSPAAGDQPIVHSDHLLLVDGTGNVRGVYDSQDVQSVKQLASDASALAGWSILP